MEKITKYKSEQGFLFNSEKECLDSEKLFEGIKKEERKIDTISFLISRNQEEWDYIKRYSIRDILRLLKDKVLLKKVIEEIDVIDNQ